MRDIKIAPSLLSANFANLEADIRQCEKGAAELLHIDVMDGHFVPNITIGPLVPKALKKVTDIELDCHLMIMDPDKYIMDFVKAGAAYISIHAEVCKHLHRSLSYIRESDASPGIALNPVTPLEYAYEAAEYADFILLMSVNPGFGGQAFIPSFLKRAEKLRNYLDKNGLERVDIEVDGGVKINNTSEIVSAGANWLVSGSGLFKGDLTANIIKMREEANKGLKLKHQ